jgi:hypothetical protein
LSNELPDVLIREVGGEGRWSQFSVVLENVQEYFGTQPDVPYTISLRHVTSAGRLEAEEHPAWISKGSGNWAFDLQAATNLQYPDKDNRPIAVLLRTGGGLNTGSGSFVYMLLMPGDPGYDLLSDYLAANFHGPAGRLRWVMRSANEFNETWPDSPLWQHWP